MSFFLSPLSTMQFEDANGVPYSGAKLFTYAAGTTTKQVTYQTSTGTANTNPIILDADGRPPYGIWTEAGDLFHYFLATADDTDPPAGAAIFELDNVASINDLAATTAGSGEWISSGLTPVYISATSFSLSGDQTSIFTVGRKLKITVTAGTTYSVVKSVTYGSSITTLVVENISGTIDSGISDVFYGIISSSNTSQVDIRTPRYLVASTSNNADYTLTELSTSGDYKTLRYEDGMICDVYIPASGNNTGAVTFNINSLGAKSVVDGSGAALTVGLLQSVYTVRVTYDVTTDKFYLMETVSPALIFGAVAKGARNCINYAAVDANGYTALGGSTGTTTVTTTAISATSPLVVNASNVIYSGAMLDEVGYAADNLSWTGLSTDGTMYLYVDIAEKTKVLTTGSTTLAPVYQFGGTPSVSSGQATFNYSNSRMYVGNGSTAPQARRVFVGQVTVAANVVSAITWYSINRRFETPAQTITATKLYTFAHNLGATPSKVDVYLKCLTGEHGYVAGEIVHISPNMPVYNGTATYGSATKVDSLNAYLSINTNQEMMIHKWNNVNFGALTASYWELRYVVEY